MGEVLARVLGAPSSTWLDQAHAESLARDGALGAALSGTIYGVVLNTETQQASLGPALSQAPYKAPPQAPVLYIKTANTLNRHGGTVFVPDGINALEVNAALTVVIGRTACRTPESQALEHVLGYTIALDVCEPHTSYYRPAIRQRCRDGFLPVGPWTVPAGDFAAPDAAEIVVEVNGAERSRWSTSELVRSIPRLIADISDFMTLQEGDALLVGLAPRPATARVGDRVSAQVEGLGRLDVTLAGEDQ